MIQIIAGFLWLGLWITAPPNQVSKLKVSYPNIEAIELVRAKFLHYLNGVTEDSQGLVAGLAIGERGLISEQLAEQMKVLSLTHLVAVSGANLAIITAAVFLTAAASGATRNLRFVLAYLAMAAYILLVGPESSVLRAGAMAGFVMAGWWIGRRVNPLSMLSWAVFFLLIIDPGLAVDFGFALSAFATAGLLVLAGKMHEILEPRLGTWLSLGVSASVAAQLYTMPILLMLQPSIPVYSVLANLLVEPVVAPVTILGILAVVLSVTFPPLAMMVSWLASIGTWWITFVAQHLAQLPMARVPAVQGAIGVGLMVVLIIGITILFADSKPRKTLGIVLSAIGLIVPLGWVSADVARYSTFSADWEILNCDVGQGDALLIRNQTEIAVIDVGREPEPIDNCLQGLGIDHISLLVLTHYDADHVGGISGALKNRTVDLAMLSGFQDDRPLVKVVADQLAAKSSKTIIGFKGLQGSLGEIAWKVLSPSFSAKEAEDSNDASLVLSFHAAGWSLLALGDLGESGQTRLLRQSWSDLAVLRETPLVVKVAHHGSADQSRDLYELVDPDIAILSVGARNDYGHPANRVLRILHSCGALTNRTDTQGAIAVGLDAGQLFTRVAGKLSL